MDVLLAALLLIVSGPAILAAAALIRLTSRGPAFYTQIRLGRNGRRFTIYKLRTMHHCSEVRTGAVWAMPCDPRVTPLGKILRASHLDEFPQLLNVLSGAMSLVGPRPERPEIVEYLDLRIPGYRERLRVRPGITGLAQVQLPPDIDLQGVQRKLVCDRYYMEHQSAWMDVSILACTGMFLVGVPLKFSRRALRIAEPCQAERSAPSATLARSLHNSQVPRAATQTV
jgi:lipopolysaccharide/colanic/teichoic acid biosynthesis glycosyltransferase